MLSEAVRSALSRRFFRLIEVFSEIWYDVLYIASFGWVLIDFRYRITAWWAFNAITYQIPLLILSVFGVRSAFARVYFSFVLFLPTFRDGQEVIRTMEKSTLIFIKSAWFFFFFNFEMERIKRASALISPKRTSLKRRGIKMSSLGMFYKALRVLCFLLK